MQSDAEKERNLAEFTLDRLKANTQDKKQLIAELKYENAELKKKIKRYHGLQEEQRQAIKDAQN